MITPAASRPRAFRINQQADGDEEIALNMSRTGSVSASIRWISALAMMAPMKSANARCNQLHASNEKPKHNPSTVTSSISLLLKRAT